MNIMLAWKRGQGVTKYSGIVSPAYSVYRFFNNANPDFMHYLFRTDLYTGHFKTRSTGVIDSRLRLYPESFFDVSVLLPSIEEQRTIAAFLDYETARIDSLIDKQQRLIELLKEKRQAVISHAVTKGLNPDAPMKDSGVEWLGQVPEHWEVKKFNHCARIRNGLVDPTDIRYRDLVLYAPNHIEKETGKVIYRETALEQGADSNKYLCLKGEVIYSKIRPALAKVALCVEEIALCSADMYPISCTNGLSNSWLYWFMLSDNFTKAVVLDSDRVAMPKVNRDSLGAYRIPFPSTDEQVEISSFLRSQTEKLDQIENEAVNAIQLMQERRTALISAAVTGKIDLRRWTPPREG
ncbi:restriction endonuclease subunit S [Shewanella algae]|uniref:restriction endonuclease subunit S n=1 Tax=Shewanella algae TaxID=38313 RepID=UPI0030049B88